MPRSSLIVTCALVAAVIVLLLSGYVGIRAAQSSVAASVAIARNKDILLNLERTMSAVRDAESGQRGYLLTGKEEYLQPYNNAIADLPARMTQLRASLANDVPMKARLDELQRLISTKMTEQAQTVQLYRDGSRDAALALVMTDQGRDLMVSIDASVRAIESTQARLFESELQQLDSARARAAASIFAVRFLTIGLVVTLVVVVRRDSKRVRLSEERLAITLRSIGDAVIATDKDGLISILNAVAEELTGWTLSQARGLPLEQVFGIVNEQTRAAVESPIHSVLREGRVVGIANHTLLIARDGSELPIEDSIAPIRDAAGEIVGAVLVFRDASAEREVERSLREADQKKDEFIAVLAHELRNPLAPILQAVQVARASWAKPEQLRWSYEVIERQGRTMGRLLDDLLDVSRITRGTVQINKSRVTLGEVVSGAVETVRPAIKAREHTLIVDVPEQTIVLELDPVRISQVIANLLTNATKYTNAGGLIRLSARQRDQYLVLSVADNGIGIDPQALPRVFDMFVQFKESLGRHEGGLGIGLAVSKRLVELHQGTIEARSEGINRGSEFIVQLPGIVAEDPVLDRPAKSAADVAAASSQLRVVIADDNRDAADSLAMLLEMDGHAVSVARDGNQALYLINQVHPHVALLDIGMPGMNGYQVAEQVRANLQSSATMLIALTGWGQAQDLDRAQAAGFDHHLVKPAEPNAVRSLLQAL